MFTDRSLNTYFTGVRKPHQKNFSNITSNNATFKNTLVENKLQTKGDVTFNSSLSVDNDISTVIGDIISAGSINAGKFFTTGVVTVPLYNAGGGAVPYNPLNLGADVFVDSTLGNIFLITAPAGSSLTTMYLYFNTSAEIPGNIAPVNGTIMTILFTNLASQIVTVNITVGSIVKANSSTIAIPASGYRSNIVFSGYSSIITELCRSGVMTS